MLNFAPPVDTFDEAWLLLRASTSVRPGPFPLLMVALVALAYLLVASGLVWGFTFAGAAAALALGRHGPHWWPGKR